ncbi:hypothetical protein [Desulfuromonas thiophila]|jgi:peptidoglycan/LPS O-acetylase OafA/YrhL|uniref:Uncharacterized protein n=1 Tax=Desulfuromonas thiophila TaxID=57664 RepID=A0A1G6XU23_9BACT|nr:hypothetical protein [Desulfuromonas thiophila]MDD3800952.1 hypothetical protein [Desulfuromonas thiophila]MDY0397054.1 hypothetical protein [Desulfuromonas thiophila]SDD80915.1 hypothetical protein SAMN05661003_101370 [Desulfuromonas thiophila]
METLLEWLKPLETSVILDYIVALDLVHNPWFIAGALVFVVVSLYLRWHLLLSCTLSLAGLVTLVYFVHEQGTSLDRSSDGLFLFVGGGAAIVFFLIYMVFLRGD